VVDRVSVDMVLMVLIILIFNNSLGLTDGSVNGEIHDGKQALSGRIDLGGEKVRGRIFYRGFYRGFYRPLGG
jgi:hypothetical protein